ncbi:hypothetical protein DHEL01_v206218 [Diaporthe helianthi]|uniref:Uncharacterized protein n=1 Tax=Diaporthe helianthi TaxID=158607 RepID=A0A2P5HYR4_DIAHE|nr:hypothetical protein DHEL01_v206218 [Diaporthe helianthi]
MLRAVSSCLPQARSPGLKSSLADYLARIHHEGPEPNCVEMYHLPSNSARMCRHAVRERLGYKPPTTADNGCSDMIGCDSATPLCDEVQRRVWCTRERRLCRLPVAHLGWLSTGRNVAPLDQPDGTMTAARAGSSRTKMMALCRQVRCEDIVPQLLRCDVGECTMTAAQFEKEQQS